MNNPNLPVKKRYKFRWDKLKELRIKAGYTQKEMAHILNLDQRTYQYYDSGKQISMPTAFTLWKIIEYFINPSSKFVEKSNVNDFFYLEVEGGEMEK